MKVHATLPAILLFAVIALCQSEAGYKPVDGFVPDSKTAVAIAEAVLIPVYGKKHIEGERPFTTALKGNVWTIEGTLNCPDGKGGVTRDCEGGVALVRISKSDGRVLYMLHGQ